MRFFMFELLKSNKEQENTKVNNNVNVVTLCK